MEVEIFTLCDAATDSAGKLNILGAFDRILTSQLPAVHPFCAIALRIRFARIEEGNHKLSVTFANEDGKPVLPGLQGSLAIRFREGDATVAANMVLCIQKLKLEAAGEYTIDLAIDGRHEGSIPLYVRQRPRQDEKKPGGQRIG